MQLSGICTFCPHLYMWDRGWTQVGMERLHILTLVAHWKELPKQFLSLLPWNILKSSEMSFGVTEELWLWASSKCRSYQAPTISNMRWESHSHPFTKQTVCLSINSLHEELPKREKIYKQCLIHSSHTIPHILIISKMFKPSLGSVQSWTWYQS